MRAYVVSNPELGWDSVVAVYDASTVTLEQLEARYNSDWNEYVIQDFEFRTQVTAD